MAKKYNVLWIDDKHEELEGFKIQAAQNDIVFKSFKSRKAGMAELEQNYRFYDEVLLDAKFFEEEDDAVGSEDLAALNAAKEKLLQLPKKFEIFVLTGQAQLFEDKTFNKFVPRYYRKGIAEDITKLFSDIKQTADNQVDTQIRHDNPEVFEVFEKGYLSKSVELQVLELIKAPMPANQVEAKAMLTNIRSIHESCILQLKSIGVVPSNGSPKMTDIIRHLSGNKNAASSYQPSTKEYQNDAIENLHKWVHFTCSKYIHNLNAANYNGYMISRYAVDSLRAGILELLLWFEKTYTENK